MDNFFTTISQNCRLVADQPDRVNLLTAIAAQANVRADYRMFSINLLVLRPLVTKSVMHTNVFQLPLRVTVRVSLFEQGTYKEAVPATLRSTLGTFHSFHAERTDEVIFTSPHVDAHGLGLVLSACLPVYEANTTFRGVTCVDVNVEDVLVNLTQFPDSAKPLYTFLLDKYGELVD